VTVKELAEVEVATLNGVVIAHVRGEIDLSNADSTFSTLKRLADGAEAGLVVDLSQLDYLDSAGVRLLFTLARTATRKGRSLRAVVPREARIRRVLELADVGQLLALDDTIDGALERLSGGVSTL
jgi:anti-anti-sigma factor